MGAEAGRSIVHTLLLKWFFHVLRFDFVLICSYLQLIRKEDGEEYNKNNFNDFHAEKFKFIILTKNPFPEEHLLSITYPIKVVLAG